MLYDAHPYSWLWLDAAPLTAMALWLRGSGVGVGRLLLLIATLILTDAAQNTFNDVCDVSTDRASPEASKLRRGVAAGVVSRRSAFAQASLLTVAALALAFALSVGFGMLLVGGVLYGAAYSLRISGRPYVAHGFWLVLILGMFLAAYLVLGGDVVGGLPFAVANALYIGGVESILKDVRDLEADRLGGRRTTPLTTGIARAGAFSVAVSGLAAAGWIASAVTAVKPLYVVAAVTGVMLAVWLVWLRRSLRSLAITYGQQQARALHRVCLLVYLGANLCFVLGLLAVGR